MRQLKFFSVLGLAGAFLFSSCGGNEEKTTEISTTTDSTTTTAAATPAAPETTVDTTHENVVLVKHKVADFAKWKIVYEGHDSARLANGLHSFVIGRGTDDSNTVLVALKADDIAKAKAFGKDPGLKAAMQKGGVKGPPTMAFNTMVYRDNAKDMPDLRSMTMFTVKDWNAWKTSFESNRQFRKEQGLTDRAYGHDVDDDHKVTLVVAINDTAKANAYWNSDIIKQKRAESGVVGKVERFVYRVVQKY